MPRWKELLAEQSDDFKKDSRQANEQMAKARSDLQNDWNPSNSQAVTNYWYNVLTAEGKKKLTEECAKQILQLGLQYGLQEDSCRNILPELLGPEPETTKPNFRLDDTIKDVMFRDFDTDIDYIASTYQIMQETGIELPKVRLKRNKTNQQFQYIDARETMWWFATQRRLLSCVFFVALIKLANQAAAFAVSVAVSQANKKQEEQAAQKALTATAYGNGSSSQCSKCGKETSCASCSRCHTIFYCGRECQAADWKRHKRECQTS